MEQLLEMILCELRQLNVRADFVIAVLTHGGGAVELSPEDQALLDELQAKISALKSQADSTAKPQPQPSKGT